jgi:hypothetical protein
MSTPESKIKTAVKQRLDAIGAYQFWPVQTGIGTRTLDCLGCYKGLFFGIETKRPGGVPTTYQLMTIEQIQAAGGIALVIDTIEDAHAISFSSDLQAK